MHRWSLFTWVIFLSAVSAVPSVARDTADLKFSYRNGLIWLPVRVNGQERELNFLLDSGAEQSVINLRTAKKLGVRFAGREKVLTLQGSETAHQTASVTVRLENRLTWSAPMLALDLQAESGSVRRRIDGLLGMDFMKGRAIQIDYRSQTLRLGVTPRRLRGRAIPIVLHRENPCLKLTIDDTHVLPYVRIDTGCNQSLHWSDPRQTGKAQSKGREIGFASTRSRTHKSNVVLGPARFRDVPTTLHSQPIFPSEQGLLGNALLAQFGVVTIDLPNRRLILGTH